MDDSEIVKLFFERDEAAVRQTQLKYGRLCAAVAGRILGNAEDTEECVNDCYLKVWDSIPPARPDNLKGFICRITRNLALMRLRYNKSEKRSSEMTVSLSELEEVIPDERLSVTDVSELGSVIECFLKKQRPAARKAFVLKYFYMYTQKEIAQLLSMHEDRVNSMLCRTRRRLRDYLIGEGVMI